MNILIFGQSNAVRLSNATQFASNIDPTRGAGEMAMAQLLEVSLNTPVTVINAGVGGKPLLPVRTEWWLDTSPNSLYAQMLGEVNGVQIDAVVWVQGEADAGAGVSQAEYEAGLTELFARLRGDFGDVPVYLQPLILRPDVIGDVRAAQFEYCLNDPLTVVVEPTQYLGAWDAKHFTTASYAVLGDAFARAMLADLDIAPAYETLSVPEATDDNDLLLGGTDDDDINGGRGSDLVSGGLGDDFLRGAGMSDSLFGDEGDDTLLGGGGDDILHGGAGYDLLTGGTGADRFYVDINDTITDFQDGIDIIIQL